MAEITAQEVIDKVRTWMRKHDFIDRLAISRHLTQIEAALASPPSADEREQPERPDPELESVRAPDQLIRAGQALRSERLLGEGEGA